MQMNKITENLIEQAAQAILAPNTTKDQPDLFRDLQLESILNNPSYHSAKSTLRKASISFRTNSSDH